MSRSITGVIKYVDLEGGFWGIETDQEKYFPLNLPEQLKEIDAKVSCNIEVLDVMSLQSWGTPCKIFSFTTLEPSSLWNS